jgi:RNA polymerase sigma-70 factor (ECF subfamily)
VEEGEELAPEFQSPGHGESFSPTPFMGTEDFFPGDSLRDPSPIPSARGSFFPLPHDHGPGPTPPEANAPTAEDGWPSRSPIPQSPGAALVKEFDALYQKYERRVYRQCYRMVGNQEDAEDMAQEVFLQLFRKAHTFRGEANFSTWLHRLTVNTVLMQLRRHRRWRNAVTSYDAAPGAEEGLSDILTAVSTFPAPATTVLDKLSLDVAIAKLSAGYQEIFLLHDLEGYRHEEIAKLLGISEGTSKSQLHKARLRLRSLMGSDGGGSAELPSAPAARSRHKKGCPSPCAPEYAVA